MDWSDRDTMLERLGRLGKAGGVPLVGGDPKLAIDELQRRTSTVAQAASQTLAEVFRGPRTGDSAPVFTINARSGNSAYNILTSAQANAEGLGTTSNLCIFRHGLGFVLDYYMVIRHVLHNPSFAPPNRMGNVQLYAVDDNRTVFQIDADAASQYAVITLTCWPSKVIPANGISPSKTGASRGTSGYIRATGL